MSRKSKPSKGNRSAGPPKLDEGYRWTCPFCGKSTVNRVRVDDQGHKALSALQAHIQNKVDEHHGDAYAYPEGLDPDTLPDHVEYAG